jgi:small-conductance mechanosensitive channel
MIELLDALLYLGGMAVMQAVQAWLRWISPSALVWGSAQHLDLAGAVAVMLILALLVSVLVHRLLLRAMTDAAAGRFLPLLAAMRPALQAATSLIALAIAAAPLLAWGRSTERFPDGPWHAAWVLGVALLACAMLLSLRAAEHLRQLVGAAVAAGSFDQLLLTLAARIVRGLIPLGAIYLAVRALASRSEVQSAADRLMSITVIIAIAWVLIQGVRMIDPFLLVRYRIDTSDNLQARRVYTQALMAKKILYLLVGIFTVASLLMQFDGVRQVGTSMLASAGLASVILGFSAQRIIANLLAGIQVAFTQPIRMDDAVIIEGEFGRIEEINLTYVVVALWDQRRLIVPIAQLIEKPFQNWTRSTAQMLGAATLRADYTVPVQALREELKRIAASEASWDGRVCALQVTDCGEHTIELRALVSAGDAGKAFDLRCAVRERLVSFLQQRYPGSLPRWRAETQPAATPPGPAITAG